MSVNIILYFILYVVLTDEERHERKMHSAALYKSYLNRSGPKNLGAKEIPEVRNHFNTNLF